MVNLGSLGILQKRAGFVSFQRHTVLVVVLYLDSDNYHCLIIFGITFVLMISWIQPSCHTMNLWIPFHLCNFDWHQNDFINFQRTLGKWYFLCNSLFLKIIPPIKFTLYKQNKHDIIWKKYVSFYGLGLLFSSYVFFFI